MSSFKAYMVLVISVLFLTLTGCGGGGGAQSSSAQTINGVAATGAPILGSITLKDKNGVQRGPVATGTDGSFTLDVTGLTFPIILKADWISASQTYSLYSVVTSSGTANINPLTDIILQLAVNSDPAAIFAGSGTVADISQVTDSSLAAAQAKLQILLSPLLSKYGITSFSPLLGTYVATPDNKLDAMLDVISIKIVGSTLTITNKLDGSIIATGDIANVVAIALDITRSPDSAVLTDIKEITQTLATLRSVMNLGAALTINAVDSLYITDPNYGTSNNSTRTMDMGGIVTIFGPGGINTNGRLKSIQNLQLLSDQTVNYPNRGVTKVYLLRYDFIFENGTLVHGTNVTFGKDFSSGTWKFIGDPVGGYFGGSNASAEAYGVFVQSGTIMGNLSNSGWISATAVPGVATAIVEEVPVTNYVFTAGTLPTFVGAEQSVPQQSTQGDVTAGYGQVAGGILRISNN